jgi:hypothetical protein
MKHMTLFTLMILFISLAACGKKESGSNSSHSFSSDPYKTTTLEALVNAQSGNVEVSGVSYSVSQQSIPVMMQAFQEAQRQGIQPTLVNGVYKFKIRITGYLANGYQQGSIQPYAINQITVVQATIHR